MYLFGWFGPLSEDAGNVLQYLFVESIFNPIDLACIVPLVTGGIFVAYYYLKRRNIHGDEMLMIDYVLFKDLLEEVPIFSDYKMGMNSTL